MLGNMNISGKLGLGFGVLVLLVTGLSVFSFYAERHVAYLYDKVESLKDDEILSQRVVKRVYEGRMHVLGAIATGDGQRWESADLAFGRAHQRLEQLLSRDMDVALITDVERLKQLLLDYQKTTNSLRQTDNPTALPPDQIKSSLETSALIGREIDALSNRLAEKYEASAGSLSFTAKREMRAMTGGTAAMGALVVLMGIGLYATMVRTVARPVKKISDAMKGLAEGQLDVEVPDVESQDELAHMIKAMQTFKEVSRLTEDVRKEEQEAKRQGRAPMRWLR